MKSRLALALLLVLAAPAAAQQPARDQGDWPCRQVKVPRVALAAVWSGPSLDAALASWRGDAAVADLVRRLAARRTPMEEAQRLIADFANSAGDRRKERLTLLFAGVYDSLDSERGEVIAGLERYGRRQKEMAEKLRADTQALREAQSASADFAKLREQNDALQWSLRVFEERRKAVSFVCETPALIEQRLGALARAVAGAME